MKKAASLGVLLAVIAAAFLAGSWYTRRAVETANAAAVRKVIYYACPMHPQYTSQKPGDAPCCGMRLEPVYSGAVSAAPGASNGPAARSGALTISPERQQLLGVRVSRVGTASGTHTLRLFGRIAADETRIYRLTAGVDGWIGEVAPVTVGSQVDKNQVLATFSSVDLFQFTQAYLFALTGMDRLKQSGDRLPAGTNPTNSNFNQRIEQLHSLGMSDLQIEEIRRTRLIPKSIQILAPARGFVLARNVSPGQRFAKDAEWFRIADLKRVWILADVFQSEAQHLRPGVRAQVSLPAQRKTFPARVSEVLPQFDGATRTLKVRIEADNAGYLLRPDMFVDVELPIQLPAAIAVPADAVLDTGLKKTVFVEAGDGVFEPRAVETGWRFGDQVEIVSGLRAGERIAVSGTFLMDSESRMRAAAQEIHDAASQDPVCGMSVVPAEAKAAGRAAEYRGTVYYFCSELCQRRFARDVVRYASQDRAAVAQPSGLK